MGSRGQERHCEGWEMGLVGQSERGAAVQLRSIYGQA